MKKQICLIEKKHSSRIMLQDFFASIPEYEIASAQKPDPAGLGQFLLSNKAKITYDLWLIGLENLEIDPIILTRAICWFAPESSVLLYSFGDKNSIKMNELDIPEVIFSSEKELFISFFNEKDLLIQEFCNKRQMNRVNEYHRILTERERQILILLKAVDDFSLIAKKLDIAESTIRKHLTKIYRKIGAGNKKAAIDYLLLFNQD